MSSFKNKSILVTGGSSGIGLLLAKKSIREGAEKIIIWDVNNKAMKKAEEELGKGDYQVFTDRVDVSKPEAVHEAANEVLNNHGTVDILFNNAGIVTGKNFHQQSSDEITKTMAVNSLGLMYVAREFLPAMKNQKDGHIINITSAAGLTPNPGMAVYAGSKWAAVGWSESLKLELEKAKTGVKVLTVMPGYIDTGMFEGVTPPLFMPLLDPDDITEKIIKAVKRDKARLREPFLVKLTPFIKGILPASVYDFLADKLFGVYSSMDTFTGRNKKES
ncbi:SDR family oxidoreductase [Gracilimonas mengyeensis]|uniref:Short-chain dehydrogenase n=1 Tax=Gracilimonas mengyeensis TaxID=1302730 RepID=A0A521EMN2_9BACT|nr:SDR family oxidoreductase [Gracilimonas mengyeensis]SMO84711.1 hypothetical protein SAMN06265219_112131 [Gracilimonas mengyeensis]